MKTIRSNHRHLSSVQGPLSADNPSKTDVYRLIIACNLKVSNSPAVRHKNQSKPLQYRSSNFNFCGLFQLLLVKIQKAYPKFSNNPPKTEKIAIILIRSHRTQEFRIMHLKNSMKKYNSRLQTESQNFRYRATVNRKISKQPIGKLKSNT